MHQIEVNIVESEICQTLLKALLNTGVVRAPQLSSHEEILALDNAGVNGLLNTLTNFVLISVAKSSVNVTVSHLDGVEYSALNLAGLRLPCSQAECGDLRAGVELQTGIIGSHFEFIGYQETKKIIYNIE